MPAFGSPTAGALGSVNLEIPCVCSSQRQLHSWTRLKSASFWRASARGLDPALRLGKDICSTADRRLEVQRTDCSRPGTSQNENEHSGAFTASSAIQAMGSLGLSEDEEEEDEGSDSLEDEDGPGDDGSARSGAEDPDDEEEMLGDEDDQEYQKLRRIEVSWKFQKVTNPGGLSRLKEAEEEIVALEEEGISVDAKLATDLINAYIRCGKTDLGLGVFKKYFEEGDLQADDVVIAVMLRGLGASSPPDWATISSLLGRVEKEFKLKLSVVIYNELLTICSKSGAVGKGMQLIDEMAGKGVEADYGTLAAVRQKKTLRSHLRKVFSKF